MAQTENRTVKRFDASRGFGFIEQDNGVDMFMRANEMADPLARLPEDNERLAFELVRGEKRPAAKNVRRLSA